MTAWAAAAEANDRCFAVRITPASFNNRDDAEWCWDNQQRRHRRGIADELNSRSPLSGALVRGLRRDRRREKAIRTARPRVIASKHKLTEDETRLLVEFRQRCSAAARLAAPDREDAHHATVNANLSKLLRISTAARDAPLAFRHPPAESTSLPHAGAVRIDSVP